jgi:hypothetical protein
MSQHMQMLEEIETAIMSAGRGILPHVAGIGVVREVAENSSEVELNGSDHKIYVLSIIEKDGVSE